MQELWIVKILCKKPQPIAIENGMKETLRTQWCRNFSIHGLLFYSFWKLVKLPWGRTMHARCVSATVGSFICRMRWPYGVHNRSGAATFHLESGITVIWSWVSAFVTMARIAWAQGSIDRYQLGVIQPISRCIYHGWDLGGGVSKR